METQTNDRIARRRLDMPLTPAVADAPLVAARHVGKRITLWAIRQQLPNRNMRQLSAGMLLCCMGACAARTAERVDLEPSRLERGCDTIPMRITHLHDVGHVSRDSRESARVIFRVVNQERGQGVPAEISLMIDSIGRMPFQHLLVTNERGVAAVETAPGYYYLRVVSLGFDGGVRRIQLSPAANDTVRIALAESAICDASRIVR